MKASRLTEEQIIGILLVGEDQEPVRGTVCPTKVRQPRSALTFAASTVCRKGRSATEREARGHESVGSQTAEGS